MEFILPKDKVEKPIPKHLYIYMGLDNVIKVMENKGVYLSKASKFNDPFEELYSVPYIGSTTYKTWVTFQQIIEFYLTDAEYIKNHWGSIDFDYVKSELARHDYDWVISIENAVEKFIAVSKFDKIPADTVASYIKTSRLKSRISLQDETIKIACFCDTYKSIPMWAYYGKNHTGCCVRFDLSLLNNKNIKQNIFPISYCDNRDNENVHYRKSIGWMHEDEWRVMLRSYHEDYLPFDCITRIYFGINNDFSDTYNEKSVWYNKKNYMDKKYTLYDSMVSQIKNQITLLNYTKQHLI